MPAYNPEIIEKYAAHLYNRASSIIWKWGCIGMAIGGTAGYFVAKAIGFPHPPLGLAILAAGVFIGLFVGRSIGTDRAFHLYLQAQTALCQVEIERNTRRQ